jgi:hypothetical protein
VLLPWQVCLQECGCVSVLSCPPCCAHGMYDIKASGFQSCASACLNSHPRCLLTEWVAPL